METNKQTEKEVTNVTFTEGKSYSATIKGFTYRAGFAMLVIFMNSQNMTVILGDKSEHPISELIALKGHSVEFIYKGVKNHNGTDYPRLSMECVAL